MIEDNEFDRKTYIGGSDVAAILGVSPWKSPFLLYQEKIGEHVEEISEAKQKIFARGKRWEPVVIEMLVDELESRGHTVEVVDRNRRYTHPDYDFIKAEIDLELLIDGELVNGEMKTVHPFAAKDWGEQESDEIPVYYAAQVMLGMMVKPRNRTIVAALIGADDLRVHWVNRDQEIIDGILAKELAFWQRVQDRDAPVPETAEDVKWLYAMDGGTVMEADDVFYAMATEFMAHKAQLKNLENVVESQGIKLRCAIGDAATVLYNGKPILTWKNNKPSIKTDWQKAFLQAQEWLRLNSLDNYADELTPLIADNTKTVPGARVLRLKGEK